MREGEAVVSVKELAKMLGIGRVQAYAFVRSGGIYSWTTIIAEERAGDSQVAVTRHVPNSTIRWVREEPDPEPYNR